VSAIDRHWVAGCINSQWCGVSESLAKVTGDLVLRREIDLLEQLWRDGDAARSLDLPERGIGVHAVVEVISSWLRETLALVANSIEMVQYCRQCVSCQRRSIDVKPKTLNINATVDGSQFDWEGRDDALPFSKSFSIGPGAVRFALFCVVS
jgi:hypothetical protein